MSASIPKLPPKTNQTEKDFLNHRANINQEKRNTKETEKFELKEVKRILPGE